MDYLLILKNLLLSKGELALEALTIVGALVIFWALFFAMFSKAFKEVGRGR